MRTAFILASTTLSSLGRIFHNYGIVMPDGVYMLRVFCVLHHSTGRLALAARIQVGMHVRCPSPILRNQLDLDCNSRFPL